MKKLLLILLFIAFGNTVYCSDSTLSVSASFSGRISKECFFQKFNRGNSVRLWTREYFPAVGLEGSLQGCWKNILFGVQYTKNNYETISYINYATIDPTITVSFDSLYGNLSLHLLEFKGGYNFSITQKIDISILARFGPKAIKGKGYTVGRYYKDSFVRGIIKHMPGYTYGFDLLFNYQLTKKLELSIGLHIDEITLDQNYEIDGYINSQIVPEAPENKYYPAGSYYGANLGLIYKLR
jgi:hypothetical protein